MRRIISITIIAMLIVMLCLLGADGDNEVIEPKVEEVVVTEETVIPKTVPKPEPTFTRLNVTILDGMNENVIELKNCIVNIIGELHVVEDSFTYSKTFVEGDRYSITIWIKVKK